MLFDEGVDAPKPSEVETSEQLPTSSSNSEKQPSATTDESKPGQRRYKTFLYIL